MAKTKALESGAANIRAVSLNHRLEISHADFSYQLQLECDQPMLKINLIGPIQLLESGLTLHFSCAREGKTVSVVKLQRLKKALIKFRYSEAALSQNRLECTVFVEDGQKRLALSLSLTLKCLWQQQRLDATEASSMRPSHRLEVTGGFKYPEMNRWLDHLFVGFGPSPADPDVIYIITQAYLPICYGSILTRAKTVIKYKSNLCEVQSQSVACIAVVKQFFIQKAQEKDMSLSFTTTVEPEALRTYLSSIEPRMLQIQELRRQFGLLPGLA